MGKLYKIARRCILKRVCLPKAGNITLTSAYQCYFYTNMASDDRTIANNWRVSTNLFTFLRHIFEMPSMQVPVRSIKHIRRAHRNDGVSLDG